MLSEADPGDTQKQRDLSISFSKLGDVFLTLGRTGDALTQFEDGWEIRRKLSEANPGDAQKQRDLSFSFNKLGDVFLTLGRTDDALTRFEDGLEISRTLAEADPSDAQKQVDLWILHVRLAHVWIRKGDFAKALPNLASGMETGERELSKNSQFFNPYNLACFRSLKVLQHSLQNPEPDQTQVTERERLEADAIQALQLLIDGGFRNFASIQHDLDFSPLRGLPEFEALFPEEEKQPE